METNTQEENPTDQTNCTQDEHTQNEEQQVEIKPLESDEIHQDYIEDKVDTDVEIIYETSEKREMPVLVPAVDENLEEECKNCGSPRPLSNDSGVGTTTSDSDIVSVNSMNVCSTVVTRSPETGTDPVAALPSPPTNNGISPPPQPPQPVRRRPGRPPGSTKKYRQLPGMTQCGSSNAVMRRGTDFTLRKFFEAGGRDYNDYLEWLKRRDNGESVPFLAGNGVIPGNHTQAGPVPGPVTVMAGYPNMPYPQRSHGPVGHPPAGSGIPLPYRQVPAPPHTTPIAVPAVNYYQMQQQQQQQPGLHPQHAPQKRTSEEVLDLSAKKSKLDPNGNVIGSVNGSYKTQGCESPCDRLQEGIAHISHPITTWGVEKVASFVGALPECQDYAEVFREQKIDGATLPHLSEEHLLNIVKMKLGPAIRLRLEVQKLTTTVT